MVYTTAPAFGRGAPVTSGETSVFDMIGKYLFPEADPGRTSVRRGSVDSCDEIDSCESDLEVQIFHQDVSRQLEVCLTEAKTSTLHCQVLLLPRGMTVKVGQDLIRSSAEEPCGLRGAFIQVYLEDNKGQLTAVGSFSPDPSITPTFELSVVLRPVKDDLWLKNIFDSRKVLKLRADYRLVKRKLYSSASPVVHEFR